MQVGETHVDVQRTASSNDQTDSACLKSMPNKKCIGLCILLIVLTTYTLQLASINSIVSLVNIATTKNNKNHMNNNNANNNDKPITIANRIHKNNQLVNCMVF